MKDITKQAILKSRNPRILLQRLQKAQILPRNLSDIETQVKSFKAEDLSEEFINSLAILSLQNGQSLQENIRMNRSGYPTLSKLFELHEKDIVAFNNLSPTEPTHTTEDLEAIPNESLMIQNAKNPRQLVFRLKSLTLSIEDISTIESTIKHFNANHLFGSTAELSTILIQEKPLWYWGAKSPSEYPELLKYLLRTKHTHSQDIKKQIINNIQSKTNLQTLIDDLESFEDVQTFLPTILNKVSCFNLDHLDSTLGLQLLNLPCGERPMWQLYFEKNIAHQDLALTLIKKCWNHLPLWQFVTTHPENNKAKSLINWAQAQALEHNTIRFPNEVLLFMLNQPYNDTICWRFLFFTKNTTCQTLQSMLFKPDQTALINQLQHTDGDQAFLSLQLISQPDAPVGINRKNHPIQKKHYAFVTGEDIYFERTLNSIKHSQNLCWAEPCLNYPPYQESDPYRYDVFDTILTSQNLNIDQKTERVRKILDKFPDLSPRAYELYDSETPVYKNRHNDPFFQNNHYLTSYNQGHPDTQVYCKPLTQALEKDLLDYYHMTPVSSKTPDSHNENEKTGLLSYLLSHLLQFFTLLINKIKCWFLKKSTEENTTTVVSAAAQKLTYPNLERVINQNTPIRYLYVLAKELEHPLANTITEKKANDPIFLPTVSGAARLTNTLR